MFLLFKRNFLFSYFLRQNFYAFSFEDEILIFLLLKMEFVFFTFEDGVFISLVWKCTPGHGSPLSDLCLTTRTFSAIDGTLGRFFVKTRIFGRLCFVQADHTILKRIGPDGTKRSRNWRCVRDACNPAIGIHIWFYPFVPVNCLPNFETSTDRS
jgi:hypothetical protein